MYEIQKRNGNNTYRINGRDRGNKMKRRIRCEKKSKCERKMNEWTIEIEYISYFVCFLSFMESY